MPSRRAQLAMSPGELRNYLRTQGRLILVSNGPGAYPHPVPMNYVFDTREHFLLTSFRKSQKVRNLQRDPKAALLVESGLAYEELKSVLAYARAEIIDDAGEVMKVMAMLLAKNGAIAGHQADTVLEQARATAGKRVVLRFSAERYVSWDHGKLGGKY